METPGARHDRYLYAGIITAGFWAILAGIPIFTSGDSAKKVAIAVYGERPLGIPWQVFHCGIAFLLSVPMPFLASSFIQVHRAVRLRRRTITGLVSLLTLYFGLPPDDPMGPPLRRVLALIGLYLALTVAWILYAGALGI